MPELSNIELIRGLYEAFLRNDLAAVLGVFSEDVDFLVHGPAEVPFAGSYSGRAGVERFFRIVGEVLEREPISADELVREVVGMKDRVFAFGHDRVRIKATGKTLESWWVHVFTIEDGRIVRFREMFDVHSARESFRGDESGGMPGESSDPVSDL